MVIRKIISVITTALLSVYAVALHANNGMNTGHNWMPYQPDNTYWQAPNFNFPANGNTSAPVYNPAPVQNQAYQQPAPSYREPPRPTYQPAPYMNNYMPGYTRPNNQPLPKPFLNNGYPPPPGPYSSHYRPSYGAPTYYRPGYYPYRNNNGGNNNNFWGRSGPGTWIHPNKRNMEQGWDDMINAPGRLGEMPGGWRAPEVTMPNPIDMGDQMQENVKDLPEQIRDMNVGN
ncbi:MAG: hypothetical protein COB77_01920 [Gammaproteobacteria bacterium]|nr:MAG: hypothetical protein COB77_01920 [Gammaproteobacteria bacterium]